MTQPDQLCYGTPRVMAQFKVITWTNLGNRIEYETSTFADASKWAKGQRSVHNRTVKISDGGDAIRHWSRTLTAKRNHWATHSTAECSR